MLSETRLARSVAAAVSCISVHPWPRIVISATTAHGLFSYDSRVTGLAAFLEETFLNQCEQGSRLKNLYHHVVADVMLRHANAAAVIQILTRITPNYPLEYFHDNANLSVQEIPSSPTGIAQRCYG
ncbi:hypothetical protein EJ04DRAFT_103200 [Polyplosphaeria fusca]|uniref:Uncharacterized protein n=1 Tax=Polyplosphaeria fusca TaxID=682080 RepID=A0A9P4R678_9PLEO|nr:hypothetical protein EJ04DRAFT_103200 [Polyplosphaeria fusca]